MCKRYFFILFVLKICTFRFANYNSNISSRGINKKGVLRNAIIDYQ